MIPWTPKPVETVQHKQSWQSVDRKSPALASGLLVLMVAQVPLLLAV